MIHTCNPKKTTFSRGRRGRVGWGHLWDLFYCEDVPGVRWANADHWDLPQDVAQTMTDSNWEVSTWLLFANSPKLSCMRLKIEVKEEPWGQTSVKGKTVDKIILTEVSQTGKEKKRKIVHEPGEPHPETVWSCAVCGHGLAAFCLCWAEALVLIQGTLLS